MRYYKKLQWGMKHTRSFTPTQVNNTEKKEESWNATIKV